MLKVNRLGMTAVGFVFLTSGCNQPTREVTQAFIMEVNRQRAQPIESLPKMKAYDAVVYSARSLRDPFTSPEFRTSHSASRLQPNLGRPAEPLEAFSLDTLRMVGTLRRQKHFQALIKDAVGIIHAVEIGNYMGRNYGKIIGINTRQVEVNEIVPDHRGGWRLRHSSLALGE